MEESQLRIPLLDRLSTSEQSLLIQHSNLLHKDQGSYIFMEGEKATHFFFIKEGKVRVHKLLEEGKEITIFIRERHDAFGEIGPFSGATYSCSSRAATGCEIYAIDQDSLFKILKANGSVATEFIKWMAEKLETSSSKIKDYLMFGAEGAVASFLIRLANLNGIQLKKGVLIEKPLTHYDISTHIGISRETVTRVLNDLKKEDIIYFRRNALLIKNMAYLRSLLDCDKCGVQNCIL